MDEIFLIGLLGSTLRFAAPLIFAALGETMGQRAGVLNVGLEGMMLLGAFLGVWGAVQTGSPWGGFALAALGGMTLAGIHGWFSITLKVDQIVSGIAIIVLGLGLSGFLFRLGGIQGVMLPSVPKLDLGPLSQLPIVGPSLFSQQAPVYAAILLAIVLTWFISRTRRGLEIRAIGENPAAADSVGVPVDRLRWGCVLFGGALAGLGGAFLSVGQVGGFVENMVSGRGFIAVACVVFGRWNPLGVLAACLFFGLAEAAQIRLQTLAGGVPFQFFVMMPYVLAIVALAFLAGRSRLPSALGIPYLKDR